MFPKTVMIKKLIRVSLYFRKVSFIFLHFAMSGKIIPEVTKVDTAPK